jgi:hypothetical protein
MTDAPDPIVTFLERALAQARAGRVLFLVASAGVVGEEARKPSLVGLDVRSALGGLPAPAPSTPAATQAPTRTYGVDVGAFVGAFAEGMGPHELASAMKDCVSGVRYAEAGLAAEVADRVEAKLPAKEKRS